jgi:hypothetical protein
MDYKEMWKADVNDVWLGHKKLQGEGRWFESYIYKDNKGNYYEVWVDQDGDSKIVESTYGV